MNLIKDTDFKNLGEKKTGKVRDIYIQKDKIILISTDRHTSFDRLIAHIPHKGQVLNQISAFWFEHTKDIVQNHVLNVVDPNVLIAKKCRPLPIEVIVRGYMTGVTDTSLWTHYEKGQRDFGGFILRDHIKKNEQLDTPVLTPTTKSDAHDIPLTPEDIVRENIVSQALWNEIADKAIKLFQRGQEIAQKVGLILVDTKYEFGIDEEGKLILIDEIHTPDSSRYWQAQSYLTRFAVGEEPEYFDKEFLRLWFKENCDPYKDAVLPEAPEEMITELSKRYIHIFEQLTKQTFDAQDNQNSVERMRKNLKPYMTM
jgi:phosphoribosylaminoimidazole-succinocarboxamide synthase